jgi:hypothetical protein
MIFNPDTAQQKLSHFAPDREAPVENRRAA